MKWVAVVMGAEQERKCYFEMKIPFYYVPTKKSLLQFVLLDSSIVKFHCVIMLWVDKKRYIRTTCSILNNNVFFSHTLFLTPGLHWVERYLVRGPEPKFFRNDGHLDIKF